MNGMQAEFEILPREDLARHEFSVKTSFLGVILYNIFVYVR